MISDWLQNAEPGFYWVSTYILSWIFLILWTPMMVILAIPIYGLDDFPDILKDIRDSYIWLALQWPKRKH